MSDQPAQPPVDAPAVPPVVPPVAPAVPAVPPVEPQAQAQPPPETPPATPTPDVGAQRFEWTGKDGTSQSMTLQEMADRAEAGTAPAMDADARARFDTFEAAVKGGDPAASHKLLDLYATPQADPKAATVPQTEVEQLRDTVAQLQKTVQEGHQPVMDSIRAAQENRVVSGCIEQTKEQVPYLAHAQEGSKLVLAELNAMQEIAMRTHGWTAEQFRNHPESGKILSAAMVQVNGRLKNFAERFSTFTPAVASAAPAAPGTEVVNDQASKPGHSQPGIMVSPTGEVTDNRGNAVIQNAYGGMDVVPSVPLVSEPSGSAVAPTVAPTPSGPYSLDQMKANVRNRATEVAST